MFFFTFTAIKIIWYDEENKRRKKMNFKIVQVMHIVPKACDDMMQVGRLQNFDGNLNAQGKLIFQVIND